MIRTVRTSRPRSARVAVAAAAGVAGAAALAIVASGVERPGPTTAGRLASMLLLVAASVLIVVGSATGEPAHRLRGAHLSVARTSLALTAAMFAVMVAGASEASPPTALRAVHEAGGAGLVVGLVALAWLAVRRERRRPVIRVLAAAVAALSLLEAAAADGPLALRPVGSFATAHQAISGVLWAAMVALCALAYRLPPGSAAATSQRVPAFERGRAYLQLTKPRIILLLLITTVPAMILAAGGMPSPWLIGATLVGGSMAAGAANAINCYLDRDIDAAMSRTRRRPLPRHAVEPRAALRFGVVLAVAATLWLAVATNVLAAALSGAAILFYVFVYTAWMKRSTPQNIVVGGAAGAVPALVGWAAVTGRVGLPSVLLFAVVFLWTPPHFWALSLRYVADYRAAGVPMLPVVRGIDETTRQIVVYSLALIPLTLLLAPVAHLGLVYLPVAAALGAWLATGAIRLRRGPSVARAVRLFHASNAYLALLFAAVAVDVLVRVGT